MDTSPPPPPSADHSSSFERRCLECRRDSADETTRIAERNRFLERQNRSLRDAVRNLSRMVYVDGLTGLANRRYFEAVLKTEIRRAARAGTPLTLALCDIDHFKRFNDTYGHQCGDRVLRLVGETMIGHCRRPGDVAARYGGEEFALLLPGLHAWRTIVVVDKLRQCVAETSARAGIVPDGSPVTISVGYTTFCAGQSPSASKVTRAADIALYRAKNSGRNRIMYEPVHQPDMRHRPLLANPSP